MSTNSLRRTFSREDWATKQSAFPVLIQDKESFVALLTVINTLGTWDDLHLHEGYPIVLKASGTIFLSTRSIERSEIQGLSSVFYNGEEGVYGDILMATQFDPSFSAYSSNRRSEHRYRVHMTACESGEGGQGARITCRSIKEDIPSISDVGLTPSEVNDLFPLSGATFICGVTGSGKNTTMAAAIAYLIANGTEPRVVIELAAPIEYSYRATQLAYPERVTHIIQQELHRDFSSWSQGIKSSLRSGPDGIIISELRDYETIDQALVAAGTGHHLLGTLHSATPVETFNRLLKVFPEDQKPRVLSELVAVIRVLMNQRLWPAVGGGVLAVRAWFKLTHEIKSNLSGLKPEEYTAALLRHYIDQGKTFSDNAERLYQLSEITLETRDRIIADERSELEKSK